MKRGHLLLAEYFLKHQMSQKDFTTATNGGVSFTLVSNYLRGRRVPSLSHAYHLHEASGGEVDPVSWTLDMTPPDLELWRSAVEQLVSCGVLRGSERLGEPG